MITKAKNVVKPKRKSAKRRYGPGRPTSSDLEQRKSRILDIATALFLEKGYAEASLVDVAKLSGVATRTIYQHYGDKEAIFVAVVNKYVNEAQQEFPEIDTNLPLFDVLLHTADHICEVGLSDAAIPFQRLMVAEGQRFPKLIRQVFQVLYRRLHTNVQNIFERLAAQGEIPEGDHTQSTKFFIDLLLGSAPMQLSMEWIKSRPTKVEISSKVALFITGRYGVPVPAGALKPSGRKASGKKGSKPGNKAAKKKGPKRKTASEK